MNLDDVSAAPEQEAVRLNMVATALLGGWGKHIPLDVRYRAARLADAIVAAWFGTDQVCGECGGSGHTDGHGWADTCCPTCQGRGTLSADIIIVHKSGLPSGEYDAEQRGDQHGTGQILRRTSGSCGCGSAVPLFALTPRTGESQ